MYILPFAYLRKLCLYVLFLISFQKIFAQEQPFKEVNIASPNAASLGKYGDIPVGYHTGVPQTTIPIYSVTLGNLILPISISYHAGGLKVLEPSSWVGAGWSLNAGGVITRTVRGAADDRGFGSSSNVTHGHYTDYGYNNYWWEPNQGNVPGTFDNMRATDLYFGTGEKDSEPDLYFFNFGNYNGKFYFRDDRTPVIVPEADFKIEPLIYSGNVYIQAFVITTPDGTKYYFGKNQESDGNINAWETTNPYTVTGGITYGSCISSWYLNKIVSADDQFTIKLIYEVEQYSYYTISTFAIDGESGFSLQSPTIAKGFMLVKNYVDGVRLSKISFLNGVVNFKPGSVREDLGEYQSKTITDYSNTESKSLGAIEITDSSQFCKSFKLTYDYFIDNTTSLAYDLTLGVSIETDKKRLRLNSITERSCDSSTIGGIHRFSYLAPSGDSTFAPRRLSFAQDHWGYYNGKTNNATLIPTFTLNTYTTIPGGDRESSWPEMSYGTLKKITYPTGGNTQFDFEANDMWFNYSYNTEYQRTTASIGPFIGQPNTQTVNITLTANPYKLTLDFHTNSSMNSSGSASFGGLSVDKANPHAEIIIQPGAGAQTYYLQSNNMSSTTSDWASATIYEEVPGNFQGNKVLGGLRIKTMTHKDGVTSNDLVTSYSYISSNGHSSGILYSRPVYVQALRNDFIDQIDGYNVPGYCNTDGYISCGGGGGFFKYMKTPGSVRPLSTSQGNHIGYNEVKVSQMGNGYKIYRYYGSDIWDQNLNDVCTRNSNNGTSDPNVPNWPSAPLPFEYMRGELKYEGNFLQSGQVVTESYYYPVYVENPVVTPGHVVMDNTATNYNLTTAKKTKQIIVTNNYSGSSSLTTIDSTFFESSYHHQVTRRVSLNSKGEKLESKIKYSFDFSVPNCDTISDGYQIYLDSVSAATSRYNYELATCVSGTWNCKWLSIHDYQRRLSLARINYINSRRVRYTDASNTFKTLHDNAKSSADALLKPILELQDEYVLIPIESTTWKVGQLANASFTKYDFATNPSTKAYPTIQQKIYLNSLSSIFTVSSNTNSALSKDSRYQNEASVKFIYGNISEQAKQDDITTSYLWDYNNSFPIAKCIGTLSTQIAYSSFESNGTGSWSGIISSNIQTSGGLTGDKYYNQAGFSLSKSSLTGSISYIVSYWSKNGSYAISGTQSGYPKTLRTLSRNGQSWTLYQHLVTGQSTITITGSGGIDELSLYPKGALLTTYTYIPLVGVTSQSDQANYISFYEYDKLGRLTCIRDQNQNILKKYEYQYAAQ